MKLEMYRGDTPSWNMEANQYDDTDLDISVGEIYMTAKSSARQADVDAVFQKSVGNGITVSDGPAGLFTVKLAASDTEGIYAPAYLVWDIQYINGGGDIYTLMDGTLLVKPDVTRANS